MGVEALSAQYETYPYPARNPADERQRLITGSPSYLDEVNHYVFAGALAGAQLHGGAGLRVLIAGGGTGDGTIQIAQQLADAAGDGSKAEITYLDLSAASRRVAEERAGVRGLTNIRFHTGSLLDLAAADGGPVAGSFDYIDCCGVLHHLPDPVAGLQALAGRLNPGGGIGVMVYAPFGRTGVYPMQDALRTLTAGLPAAERVGLAKRLLNGLPKGNWLLNNPFISDHRGADADLYDLLLHSCDRAYTVAELGALAAGAGLAVAALIDPTAYDPATWMKDPRLHKRLEGLSFLERAGLAEQLCGGMTKHIAYLVRPERVETAVARIGDGQDVVPVLRDVSGPELARGLPANGVLEADLAGGTVALALPRLAGPMLSRIDGRTALPDLHNTVAAAVGGNLTWDRFLGQFETLYRALNGIGKMYLRKNAVR